ncbi:hypothetical protein [Neorhizobium alkalisoli]|uniref:hypothetical protein n=1 Tax=Neorhizobium alkalisoli TaxID=528178 RepID=UPI0016448557|nr:hypothetical protein [Neorhizobium alkalisoli]
MAQDAIAAQTTEIPSHFAPSESVPPLKRKSDRPIPHPLKSLGQASLRRAISATKTTRTTNRPQCHDVELVLGSR